MNSSGTYDCLGSTDPNWCTKKGGCETDTKMNTDFPGGYCIFQPSVQVLDNWGWCNGTCKDSDPNTNDVQDTSPGGVGCYDDEVNKIKECKINSGAYTSFKFKVLVAPNKILKPIQ